MKKYFIIGLSIFALAGCQSATGEESSSVASSSESATASVVQSSSTNSDPNDVGSGSLEEIGQYTTEDGAKLTLQNIAKSEDSIVIGEGITVSNIIVKIMGVSEISEDAMEMYNFMEISEGNTLVQITYDFKNDTESTIDGVASPTVVTSTGEQVSIQNIVGEYEALPGSSLNPTGGVITVSDPNINSVELHWELYSTDGEYNSLDTDPVKVEF